MPQLPSEVLAVKRLVRQRDGGCVICGKTNEQHRAETGRQLDVHRTTPGSLYTAHGCASLCRRCHGPQPRRTSGQLDLAAGHYGINLPDDVYQALKALADRDNRPMSRQLRAIVVEALRKEGLWPPPEAGGS